MHQLVSLLQRFRRDERGAFAMIFAVAAIAIIAMSGAVVDFTGVQQARTRAQVALDAAALALQPSIYTATAQTIQTEAQNLLVASLADAATTWQSCIVTAYKPPCATVATPVIDTTNGQLTLNAQIDVPTNFVDLVGVSQIPSQIVSVATRKKLNLEVAMVLDNSGSMAYAMGYNKVVSGKTTRMQTLQSSADCAVNILFFGVKTCTSSTTGLTANTNTKIGIVPFTSAVNVGTSNASASWLDRAGTNNSITLMHFNTDANADAGRSYLGPVDRVALFSSVKDKNGNPLSWGGCVEARVNDGLTKFYDTDDTLPDTSNPQTLFTPYFAPDEPGTPNSPGSGQTVNGDSYLDSYVSDTPAACNRTGTCSVPNNANATYNAVTVIVTAKGTATVKKNSNGQTQSTTSITSTFTTGPTNGSVTTGSYSASTPTITAPNGDTQTLSGVCSCTGNGTSITGNPVNGTAATNGSVSKVSNGNTTIPSDIVTNNTPQTGYTTTDHYTSATKETDTQPMKYTVTKTTTCTGASYAPWGIGASGSTGGLTNKELQERICKYNVANPMTQSVTASQVYGPNGDCPVTPITPLSAAPTTITTAINAMTPTGATNIQEGAAWGLRVLSPTAPFTEGAAYNESTSKVLIIMTDGENTMYPSTSNMNDTQYYSAYGFIADGRIGAATTDATTLEGRVNSRLSTTCGNAKNLGITIFTIGVDPADTSDPTGNEQLLTNCATTPTDAYFPNSAADLQNAFVSIANQLAALRLAR